MLGNGERLIFQLLSCRLCLSSPRQLRGEGRDGGGKGREREGGGGARTAPFSSPLSPSFVVTLAMLLEFHKSLRWSRKWLPGFGMLFSGHCRHCWILCWLLHTRPSLSLSALPLFLSPVFSLLLVLLLLNICCGNYFYDFSFTSSRHLQPRLSVLTPYSAPVT